MILRWVRQGRVRSIQVWRPWWALGLVEVVTYPRPPYRWHPYLRDCWLGA